MGSGDRKKQEKRGRDKKVSPQENLASVVPVASGKRGDSGHTTAWGAQNEELRQNIQAQQDLWADLSKGSSRMLGSPIVQFSCFIFFCLESEPYMLIDVLRIGDLSKPSTVAFTTRDSTAKAGENYVATHGVLYFEPGENASEIRVPLLRVAYWDTTLEFVVELFHQGAVNAIPGRYLWQARVKVIQVTGDTFPTQRFSSEIVQHRLHRIRKYILYIEYCKMNLMHAGIRGGWRARNALSVLTNLYFVSSLCLLAFTWTFVLCPASGPELDAELVPADPKWKFQQIVLGLVLPMPLLQFLVHKSNGLLIGGRVRGLLQKNLLRRFLNLTASARSKVKVDDLILCMTRDVDRLGEGFMKIFGLIDAWVQFWLLILARVVFPSTVGLEMDAFGLLPMLALLLVLPLIVKCSHRPHTRRVSQLGVAADRICAHVGDTTSNYPLIADFNQRPYFVDIHEGRIYDYSCADRRVRQAAGLQLSILPLMTLCMVGVRTGVLATSVVNKKLHSGMFLFDLVMIAACGRAAWQLHCCMLDIIQSYPSLVRLVTILNLKIDMPQRMQLNRARRELTKELRAQLFANGTLRQGEVPIDAMPITVENLDFRSIKFRADRHRSEENLVADVKQKGSVEIKQGHFVVLVGPQGEGKSTLLRLIGDMIVQDMGSKNCVFVPAHLRLLHVCSEPLFFHGSLYMNLTFGVRPGDLDGGTERVVKICQRLGLGPQVLQVIRTEEIYQWGSVLSDTQRTLINLARALIANPEVLCIHKPTEIFDKNTTKIVLTLLREFVSQKGIELDPKTKPWRRPRTCIITSSKELSMQLADQIFYISSEKGVAAVGLDQFALTAGD